MFNRLLLPLILLIFASGFTLSPMSQSIHLSEKQKQAQFYLENNSSEPMPVIINVYARIQKIDGKEETPQTKDLEVFPPQLIIPPKQKRSVRVSWKGSKPNKELSFRLVAEQLPLDVSKKKKSGSGIKMLLKYVAALYVDPGETKSILKVIDIKKNKKEISITLKNEGSRHAPLINPILSLTNGSNKIKLQGDQLRGLAGENILAETTRIFNIPLSSQVSSEMKGTISVD